MENTIAKILEKARSLRGTPYRTGGMDEKGIDCSGLTSLAFSTVGIKLPRISADQSKVGDKIAPDQVKPGDLVFFTNRPKGSRITHVGIVSHIDQNGRATFIHASSSRGVREDLLGSTYWQSVFVAAVRPKPLLG
jgi:cell wall-associated NlpC family hydrolase